MKYTRALLPTVAVLAISSAVPATAQEVLQGDKRLACEAILCLSSGQRPDECSASLKRYFSIHKRKFSKTLKARRDFLDLCPSSSDEGMPSLVSAIVNGAGQCDAEVLIPQLNAQLWGECDNENGFSRQCLTDVPAVCKNYANHALTKIAMPVKAKTCGPATGGSGWQEMLRPGEFYEGGQLCKYEWVLS